MMKKRTILLAAVSAALLLGGVYLLVGNYVKQDMKTADLQPYTMATDVKQELDEITVELVQETDPVEPEQEPSEPGEPVQETLPVKAVEELQQTAQRIHADYPDAIGWLYVPGTRIDYPLMQGSDNEFYLLHAYDGTKLMAGSVFLDWRSEKHFQNPINICYGHHMKNGSMFTAICSFKDEAYFRTHERVYLYTPDHTYILKPLACLYTDPAPEKRRVKFEDRLEFNAYVEKMTRGCSYREIPEGGVDRLFSFVTCSYEFNNARTILYCSEVDAGGVPVAPAELLKKEGSTE